jgi:2-dehydropantoate 2-reductase
MVATRWARELMSEVAREGVAVAHAEGVALDSDDLLERLWDIADSMPEQISSTAQDLELGRPTEVDALNGFVTRRGAAHGVPVPVNRTLHALIKLLELATPSPTPRSHFDR